MHTTKKPRLFSIVICAALAAFADCARAQTTAAYCTDLKRVAALAMTKEKFASIAGQPRPGNFRDPSVGLTGWLDCSLYGETTYTCDSNAFETSEQAEKAQARIVGEFLDCLAGEWVELKDRSSRGYVVLHPAMGPASITLNLDESGDKKYVVRFILFIRKP